MGGGGGGGGGGYSSNTYDSDDDETSYPAWTRPNHRGSFQSWGPEMCYDFPVKGEVLNILQNEKTGSYDPAEVVSANDSTCTFEAAPLNGLSPTKTYHTF